MSGPKLGDDAALLDVPARLIAEITAASFDRTDLPRKLAQLPKFLRTFFLRFLAETFDLEIHSFTLDEREMVSDFQVDLERKDKHEPAWSLLFDFVDLCDCFVKYGLMSVPEEAIEHEAEIFKLTVRVLYNLGKWAEAEGFPRLAVEAGDLSTQLAPIHTR